MYEPAGSQIWSVQIAYQPVRPAELQRDGRTVTLLPLQKTSVGDFSSKVVVVYSGHLGAPLHRSSRLDLPATRAIGLIDDWLGIDARLSFAETSNGSPTGVWTFPIQSVSQSEGGFELVHQSVVVMPHWIVTPDREGTWRMSMRLSIGNLKAPIPAGAEPREAAFVV
jgi:hypothetical protein